MKYLEVVGWSEFQHYKDRNPPWIKLHNQLLENYEFTCLPDASKSHLLGIWMLASRTENKVPANPEWIASKLGATEKVDLECLIKASFLRYTDDSKMTAKCYGDGTVTVPSEEERRGETEKNREEKSGRFAPPTFDEVSEYCRSRGNSVSPNGFLNHYEANGWMRGKSKIKDWKACVRTWEKEDSDKHVTIDQGKFKQLTDRSWAE